MINVCHILIFYAKAYVIHTLLLCDWSVQQTASKPQTQYRKECCSVVSSRFFGGSFAWHPKKRLQRRLHGWVTKFESPVVFFSFFFLPFSKAILKPAELSSLRNIVSSLYQLFVPRFAMAVSMLDCKTVVFFANAGDRQYANAMWSGASVKMAKENGERRYGCARLARFTSRAFRKRPKRRFCSLYLCVFICIIAYINSGTRRSNYPQFSGLLIFQNI